MTENEKIAQIKWLIEKHPVISKDKDFIEPLKDAIQALEEIQQVKEIISSFPLDCGSTVEDIREIYRQLKGFLQIGTIEEFKALKEKMQGYKNQMSIYAEQHKVILASDVLDMLEELDWE